ncbi:COX15/CtaA family protein [Halalkalibacter nanhaiisediminis]|uniref:Heme A synthase n=1 Tax=Halalkalibacter nanhaiisediminis TaxID=688079 RepID=A0A562QGF8_9BACI|nr:heme A synthase [Halalkalibacter nanhaiisediminis]TWI55819.1 cytochrome c oxidase assembly protein subunit 15 [Halalkalibacter nanhaiisediminis]
MHKRLKIYGILTSIGVLIVLLQGALVTKTGSGEGCGATWPLCFGEVIPTSPALETIIEYSHRIVSGLVGAMIIVLAIWSWKQLKHVKEARFMAIMAVILIIFQGLLGAGAVVFGQSKAILALHFGISAMSLAAVVLLTILSFEDGRKKQVTASVTKSFKNYFFFVLAYCYAVIYTGAYVKHTDATLACSGFPLCNGQLFPGFEGTVGVHFFHRIAGTTLLLLLFILMIWTILRFKQQRVLVWTSVLSFILVTAQLISGVSLVFTQNQILSIGLLHALIISVLFSALCYMAMILLRKSNK